MLHTAVALSSETLTVNVYCLYKVKVIWLLLYEMKFMCKQLSIYQRLPAQDCFKKKLHYHLCSIFNSSLVNLHYTFCIFFLLFSQSVCFLLQLIKCKSYVQKLLKYIKVNMSHWSSFLLFSDNDLNCQLLSTVSCQLLTSTSPIARSFKKFHHQWEKCMATLICSRGRGFSLDPLTHF